VVYVKEVLSPVIFAVYTDDLIKELRLDGVRVGVAVHGFFAVC